MGDKVKCFGLGDYTPAWWERIMFSLRWCWRDVIYWWRMQYQRWTTGFPHRESWDFYSFHAKYCLKRLKYLREHLNGHPAEITFEQWQEILDKIIWSFEHAEDDFHEACIFPENYDDRSEVTKIDEQGITFSPCDTRPVDNTAVDKLMARRQEGFNLFATWYLHLWD